MQPPPQWPPETAQGPLANQNSPTPAQRQTDAQDDANSESENSSDEDDSETGRSSDGDDDSLAEQRNDSFTTFNDSNDPPQPTPGVPHGFFSLFYIMQWRILIFNFVRF
jgi:hypothetical protein